VGYNDKTEQLYGELASLKDSMMENLDESLQRNGKIELTMQRSESLVSTSRTYKNNSKKVKTTMRNRRYKMAAILAGVICVSISFSSFTAEAGYRRPNGTRLTFCQLWSWCVQVVILMLVFSICGISFQKCGAGGDDDDVKIKIDWVEKGLLKRWKTQRSLTWL